MMLNLQFAETMELTEVELEAVYGGDLVNVANIPGGGNWGGLKLVATDIKFIGA